MSDISGVAARLHFASAVVPVLKSKHRVMETSRGVEVHSAILDVGTRWMRVGQLHACHFVPGAIALRTNWTGPRGHLDSVENIKIS